MLLHESRLSTLRCWSFPTRTSMHHEGEVQPPERILQKWDFPHLWDPRAAGVRSEHLDQTDSQEGEGQSPVDVHEVVHDVRARALQRGEEEESSRGERVNTLKLTKNHTYNDVMCGCKSSLYTVSFFQKSSLYTFS